MVDQPTIFALSTAPGRAGVAVVRLSGARAREACERIVGRVPPPRKASLSDIVDSETKALIDHGLVIWFPAPNSFTGEDTVEFQVHGSRAVVAALLAALAKFEGCRLADPGEFARRAFDNGRIDLTQAEGLADLIDAETDAQRVQALRQADGANARLYDGWRTRIIEASALVEAAIDFSDEGDVAEDCVIRARDIVRELSCEISDHLDDGHRGEIVREGFRVVLAGPPNVGKSSLLNALARRDAAIVSEEAGTTRDVIEVRLDLGGLPVVVSDTAGIRETEASIEKEGIRRTLERARDAELIVWMSEAGGAQTSPPGLLSGAGEMFCVANKADLVAPGTGGDKKSVVHVSAKTGAGLKDLISGIRNRADKRIGVDEGAVITSARQRSELQATCQALQAFMSGRADEHELRAEDLRIAANALGRITGRIDVEDLLDQIFGRFCIGK